MPAAKLLEKMQTRKSHILIVDDDADIRRLTSQLLGDSGFRVTAVADGAAMQRLLATESFDLAVLDVMLPGEDGFALCRKLRAVSKMPIVMLTARADETDRVVGLELGADDYVVKPFSPRELVARVRAHLRRTNELVAAAPKPRVKSLGFDGWKIDPIRRELRNAEGTLVSLTGTEFDLLTALAERAQRVLSRDQLLDLVRGRTAHAFDRSIDVSISRLRRKIEPFPDEPRFIRTVRNGGYVFTAEVVPLEESA